MNTPIYTPPLDQLVANAVVKLDARLRADFEERAGIIEYDGQLDRAHAECLALLDLLISHPQCLTCLIAVEVMIDGSGGRRDSQSKRYRSRFAGIRHMLRPVCS
jgi:hypothetical protein